MRKRFKLVTQKTIVLDDGTVVTVTTSRGRAVKTLFPEKVKKAKEMLAKARLLK